MNQKSAIPILFASLVIVMLGFGIVLPLMPFLILYFNAPASALGIMMSAYSIMQFIFAPVWGRTSDRMGRKPVLLIGIAGYAVSFAIQGLAQSVWVLIVARSLAGILSSATLPTAMAYIADCTPPEERSKGVGMMGAAMGMGMIFGPMLGGVLTRLAPPLPGWAASLMQVTVDSTSGAAVNLSIPFFAAALLALLAIPFISFMLPESLAPEKRRQAAAPASASRLQQIKNGLSGPLGFLFVMAFLLSFALANLEGVLGLYGKERFNMGPSQIGLLMGAMGVLSVIQQGLVIGPLTRRVGEERVLQAGLAVSIAGLVGLALSPFKWPAIACIMVFNVGNVLLQPSVTALISRRAAGGQGEAMGLNNSFQSLGRAVGPVWAGYAYDIYNTLSFWSGALIQAVALAYALRTLRSSDSSDPELTRK